MTDKIGKPWSPTELREIARDIVSNLPFETIAKNHGRTELSIKTRLREDPQLQTYVQEIQHEVDLQVAATIAASRAQALSKLGEAAEEAATLLVEGMTDGKMTAPQLRAIEAVLNRIGIAEIRKTIEYGKHELRITDEHASQLAKALDRATDAQEHRRTGSTSEGAGQDRPLLPE